MICTLAEILTALGKAGTATPQELGLINMVWPKAERLVKNYCSTDLELTTYTEILPTGSVQRSDDEQVGVEEIGGRVVSYSIVSRDQRIILCRQTPVRQVVSIYESFLPEVFVASNILDPTGYYLDIDEPAQALNGNLPLCRSGAVVRFYGVWGVIPRSIQITYQAGYTAAELAGRYCEIKDAVILTVARCFRRYQALMDQAFGGAGIGPITSEGIADWRVSYSERVASMLVGQLTMLTPEVREMLEPFVSWNRRLAV
jgi:hypothetical protein